MEFPLEEMGTLDMQVGKHEGVGLEGQLFVERAKGSLEAACPAVGLGHPRQQIRIVRLLVAQPSEPGKGRIRTEVRPGDFDRFFVEGDASSGFGLTGFDEETVEDGRPALEPLEFPAKEAACGSVVTVEGDGFSEIDDGFLGSPEFLGQDPATAFEERSSFGRRQWYLERTVEQGEGAIRIPDSRGQVQRVLEGVTMLRMGLEDSFEVGKRRFRFASPVVMESCEAESELDGFALARMDQSLFEEIREGIDFADLLVEIDQLGFDLAIVG